MKSAAYWEEIAETWRARGLDLSILEEQKRLDREPLTYPPDLGIDELMGYAREAMRDGDELRLRHLFGSAVEMGYWRGVASK